MTEMRVDAIAPSPDNYRGSFDPAAMEDLCDSIRQDGLLQPITIRPACPDDPPGPDPETCRWRIVFGERRWRAHLALGLETIRCELRHDLDRRGALPLTVLENEQRVNLSPIARARSYAAMRDQLGLTQNQIGQRVGKKQPLVSLSLQLLDLPAPIQTLLHEGKLDAGHGRYLNTYSGFPQLQIEIAHLAADNGWPVSALRERGRLFERILAPLIANGLAAQPSPAIIGRHCMECPFNAYVPEATACLRPAHLQELLEIEQDQAVIRDANELRMAAVAEAILITTSSPPTLAEPLLAPLPPLLGPAEAALHPPDPRLAEARRIAHEVLQSPAKPKPSDERKRYLAWLRTIEASAQARIARVRNLFQRELLTLSVEKDIRACRRDPKRVCLTACWLGERPPEY